MTESNQSKPETIVHLASGLKIESTQHQSNQHSGTITCFHVRDRGGEELYCYYCDEEDAGGIRRILELVELHEDQQDLRAARRIKIAQIMWDGDTPCLDAYSILDAGEWSAAKGCEQNTPDMDFVQRYFKADVQDGKIETYLYRVYFIGHTSTVNSIQILLLPL